MRLCTRFLAALPLLLVACSGGSNGSSPADASTIDSSSPDSSAKNGDGGPAEDADVDAAPTCSTVGAACCAGSTCSGALTCKSGTCQTAPTPVTIDLVNASLEGSAPFAAQRAPYLFKDIAARTADIVCVAGVGNLADRTKLAQAAAGGDAGAGHFAYNYMVATDLSTAPSNPSDVNAAPVNPPCGGPVSAVAVNDAYACVEQNCSTGSGGDPNGTGSLAGTTQCLSQSCAQALLPLYSSPPTNAQQSANDACFDCIIGYLIDGETIATGKNNCTTQAVPPFAYEGQTPLVILSDRPLVNMASYTLGSTLYRHSILKAQVQLANGQPVDFFCGDLTSPLLDASLPYTGAYGSEVVTDGGAASNGWQEEQDHQAKEALAWIQQQIAADSVPAIIAMDLRSGDALGGIDAGAGGDDAGPGIDGGDEGGSPPVIDPSALSPEVVDQFKAAFTPTLPAAQAATCDFCPENAYNPNVTPHQLLHVFLTGFAADATISETLWGNDNAEVPLVSTSGEPAPPSGTGPLLEYSAHEVKLIAP